MIHQYFFHILGLYALQIFHCKNIYSALYLIKHINNQQDVPFLVLYRKV